MNSKIFINILHVVVGTYLKVSHFVKVPLVKGKHPITIPLVISFSFGHLDKHRLSSFNELTSFGVVKYKTG
jgi:hypothetical protein